MNKILSPLPQGGFLGELRYGWPILAGATIGLAAGASAMPFYTAGLFIGEFEREFGWTRTAWSLTATVCTLILAAIAPLVGTVVDRFGVRGPAAFSFAALAAGFFLQSRLGGDFTQYVLIQIGIVVLASASTPIAFTRPVNATFDAMRGLALGVAIGGIGFTAFVAPRLVGAVIEDAGWRTAFRQMALAVVIAAPVALGLLSLRRSKPRGQAAEAALRPAFPVRDPVFWRLMAAFFLVALAVAGFVQHFVPLLTDRGVALGKAAEVQGMLGVAVLLGRLVAGAAMDRVFAPRLAAALMTLTAGGLLLLAVGGTGFAVPAAFAIGFAMGAEVDLIAYLTARYFGMASYARLYGALYGAFLVGTALSPLMIALLQAKAGSYVPALWTSAALVVAASALFLTAPRFKTREH